MEKDTRKLKWSDIENDVQERADNKDSKFKLTGPWKKYKQDTLGFKVFEVNGEWVRNNLSIIFGHGGHGLVHEFIPQGEIWISSHHWKGCECNLGTQKVTPEYFHSCMMHEITECNEMEKGKRFWPSHQAARKVELGLKLIPRKLI